MSVLSDLGRKGGEIAIGGELASLIPRTQVAQVHEL